MPALRIPLADRFWDKVNKNGPILVAELDECWVWTGKIKEGYGILTEYLGDKKYKEHRAHILSWTWHEEMPVPSRLELDHLCRNKACVRPSHLEAVLHKVNMERGSLAQATHCANGHPRTTENTGVNSKEGWKRCLICHRERERARQQRKKEMQNA